MPPAAAFADPDYAPTLNGQQFEPSKVLYADDHELMRNAVSSIITNNAELDLIGTCSSGTELVAKFKALHAAGDTPDLVVTDLAMPDLDGVEACKQILAVDPQANIVVLSAYDDRHRVSSALSAGAIGYLLKAAPAGTLVEHMVRCAHGNGVISNAAMSALRSGSDRNLTARQLEVLALSAAGKSRSEIAAELFISQMTVKSHLAVIYERLGASNAREAAHIARAEGIIS